jgi:hypothetical protein
MVPPVLRSTRPRTKAAPPPRPPALQSEATEEAAGDSSDEYNERSSPEAPDDLEDSSDGYNESSNPKACDDSDDVAPSRALSEDAGFSPDEEPLPGTRKRASKATIPTSNTRRKMLRSTKSLREKHKDQLSRLHKGSSSGLPQHLPALGQLRITPSKNTFWINKWLAAVPGLKAIKEVRPTPITPVEITPLGSMLDIPGRRFKFSVECCDIETNWDPQLDELSSRNKYSTREQQDLIVRHRAIRKTWRIFVWNDALPKKMQKRLRLFPEFEPQRTTKYESWYKGNAKKPRRANPPPLAERFIVRGGPLDTNVCPTEAEATKIAAEASRLLNKYPGKIDAGDFPDSIDLTIKNPGRQDSEMRRTIELLSLLTLDSFDFRRLRPVFHHSSYITPGEYCLRLTPNVWCDPKRTNPTLKFILPVFVLEAEQTRSNAPARSKPWPIIDIPDNLLNEKTIQELPDIPSWWGIRNQSPRGIKTSLRMNLSAASIQKLADYLCYTTFGCFGTLNDLNTVARDLAGMKKHKFNSKGMKHGPFGGHPLFFTNEKGTKASAEVKKAISGTVPDIWINLPKHARALTMQNAYETFVKTNGDILKALEELFVSTDEVILGIASRDLDAYCKCQDDKMKQETAHYCMFCHRLVLCSELTMVEDGRTVCIRHLKEGVPTDENPLKGRIFRKANCIERSRKILKLHYRHAMRETLTTQHWLVDEKYRDGYGGIHADVRSLNPLRVSIDAVFPLCRVGSEWFLHHAENVILTSEYLNRFKGDDLPMMLAAASDAVKSKAPNKYLPDIEKTFDSLYRIRTLIPGHTLDRVALGPKLPNSWWSSFEMMMKSGVWNGTEPRYKFDFFHVKTERFLRWDNDIVKRLSVICAQIEKSSLYNPNKLSMPVGSDGAPWLWNPEHMFQDHSWGFLNRIFAMRFDRLDINCDWTNDHSNESSQTLFLTCIILWYMLDGGKDETLGVRMTIFSRHPLRFSIGRALQVDPGSTMRTGWNDPYPKSLDQFDPSSRTITMETWCMNRGKWQYTVSPENIRLFTDLLSGVSAQSPYWGVYPPTQSERSFKLPQNWRNRRSGPLEAGESDEDFSENESENESDSSENPTDFDWNDNLEDDHGLVELEEDDLVDKPDRGEKTKGPGERVVGHDGGESGARSELLSLQGNAIVGKEELFSDIMAHASLLPEDLQQSFVDKFLRYATWDQSVGASASTSVPASKHIPASKAVAASASSSRLGLFKEAIIYMIVDHGLDSFMRIEMLVNAPLDDWQEFHEGIQAPFTVEEILMFCHEMEGKSNFL